MRLETEAQVTPEGPVDPAARHRDAGDVAADLFFQNGLPRHETEAKAVVYAATQP